MWVLVVVITTLTGGQSQTIYSEWSSHELCERAAEEKELEDTYYEGFNDVVKVEYLCIQPDQTSEGYLLLP